MVGSVSSGTRFLNARTGFCLSCCHKYGDTTAGKPWAPAMAENNQALSWRGKKEHGREKSSCMRPGVWWGKKSHSVSCTRQGWMRGQWRKKRKKIRPTEGWGPSRHVAVLALFAQWVFSFLFFFFLTLPFVSNDVKGNIFEGKRQKRSKGSTYWCPS